MAQVLLTALRSDSGLGISYITLVEKIMDNERIHTEAQPGKGAAGDQWAVQMAQNPVVNAPDAEIPSNVDVDLNKRQIEAEIEQEKETGLKTTDGYVIDESGRIDNFAVEPPMYTEEHGERVELSDWVK